MLVSVKLTTNSVLMAQEISETATPEISNYIQSLSEKDFSDAIKSCVTEYKPTPAGGIAAARARERKFYSKAFNLLDSLACCIDSATGSFLVRLVAHLQSGGSDGWGLLGHLYQIERKAVEKVLYTLEDGGEFFVGKLLESSQEPSRDEAESTQPVLITEETSRVEQRDISTDHQMLDDETLPDGFADTSISMAFMQDLAVAAEQDSWILEENDRLAGMQEFLSTPKQIHKISAHLEKLRDATGVKCFLFIKCSIQPRRRGTCEYHSCNCRDCFRYTFRCFGSGNDIN